MNKSFVLIIGYACVVYIMPLSIPRVSSVHSNNRKNLLMLWSWSIIFLLNCMLKFIKVQLQDKVDVIP